MKQDLIALVDCNSFFCSCERVFRPQLAHKPVIVLSNNDGCVVARTDESKKLDIPMGVPFFKIRDICKKNNVAVFSSNFALYGDFSARVMRTLGELSDDMEVYSIDEAFLSLKGIPEDQIYSHVENIKKTVEQHVGIPVSIGVARTKVLAKLANDYAKKNKVKTRGIYCIYPSISVDHLLEQKSTMDIWGISAKNAARLVPHHIYTIKDFKYADERVVKKALGVAGVRLHQEINGHPAHELETTTEDRKNIMSTRSFGRDVITLEELKESIANHVSNAAEKLRRQDCVTKHMTVFIHTSRHKDNYYYNSTNIELNSGSSTTNKLIKYAFEGLEKIYKEGYKYKRAGVILHDFYKKDHMQMDLFGENDTPKNQKLMQAIDSVNRKTGKNTIKFAALGIDQFWKMLSQMKSPSYTTSWDDLFKID